MYLTFRSTGFLSSFVSWCISDNSVIISGNSSGIITFPCRGFRHLSYGIGAVYFAAAAKNPAGIVSDNSSHIAIPGSSFFLCHSYGHYRSFIHPVRNLQGKVSIFLRLRNFSGLELFQMTMVKLFISYWQGSIASGNPSHTGISDYMSLTASFFSIFLTTGQRAFVISGNSAHILISENVSFFRLSLFFFRGTSPYNSSIVISGNSSDIHPI